MVHFEWRFEPNGLSPWVPRCTCREACGDGTLDQAAKHSFQNLSTSIEKKISLHHLYLPPAGEETGLRQNDMGISS
jgi:hypothetical protein